MKKILLLLAVFALFTQNIDSKSVSIDEAKAIAQQFTSSSTKFSAQGINASLKLNYVARSLKGVSDFYVFNRDGGQGFVIVSGDDMTSPILGYSDKGSFDINDVPPTMKAMLEAYQDQMEWLRKNPQQAQQAPSFNLQPYGVAPILGDVHWWQGSPYNSLLPRANNMPSDCSGRCYTGCAATALAQIMKAFRHPYRGFGENSYTWTLDGQLLTLQSNFANHIYKYSNMRTGYGATQSAPDVAQLFYDIDVALNMRYYGDDGSDAYIRDIIKAMIAYFDYNPNMQYLLKSSYSYNQQAWTDMIYNEIDANRPVYMIGYRTIDNSGNPCNVGHAFVLDGYDKDGKVHVNWGFQPEKYNSYFELDMLSPKMYTDGYGDFDVEKSGFNTNQSMIIGIMPDTTSTGGVVVKQVNLVDNTMPANDVRATIDIQALSGSYSGTLKYGIFTKTSEGYSSYYTFTQDVEIEDNGIVTLDVSGSYPYLYEGRTYYIAVWSPYFNTEWNWFLSEPVPFTIGDWTTPPLEKGDVNEDGLVDVDDVALLIKIVLGSAPFSELGDMNEDGILDIDDVTLLINKVLGK